MAQVRHKVKGTVREITDPNELAVIRENPEVFEIVSEDTDATDVSTTVIGDDRPVDMPPVPQPQATSVGPVAALARGAGQGATFGLSDELEGLARYGAGRLGGEGEGDLDSYIEHARQQNRAASKQHPGLYAIGDYGSMLIPMAGPAKAAMRGARGAAKLARGGGAMERLANVGRAGVAAEETARRAARAQRQGTAAQALGQRIARESAGPAARGLDAARTVGRVAGQGAIEGALQSAGRAEGGIGDRSSEAVTGAGYGAAGGAAIPVVGKGLSATGRIISKPIAAGVRGMYKRGAGPEYRNLLDDLAGMDQVGQVKRMQLEKADLENIDLPGELSGIERKQKALEAARNRRTSELGGASKLVDRDLQDDITRRATEDVSTIAENMDRVMDAADTSLKGSAAERTFQAWIAKKPPQEAERIQGEIFTAANSMFDRAKEVTDQVIEKAAKGLLDSPSSGAKAVRVQQALDSLRGMLNEAASGTRGRISPEAMADAFMAIDVLKRRVGNMVVKTKRDRQAKEPVRGLYEEMRQFLEKEDLWGEMADVQQEINKAWSKYLDVAPAAEQAFMTQGRRSTEKAADPFLSRPEGEARKVEGLVTDIGTPGKDLDLRIMEDYTSAAQDLSDSLVKHYRDIPSLRESVGKIKGARSTMFNALTQAQQDALARQGVGVSPTQRATQLEQQAKARGVRTPNLDMLEKSQRRVEGIKRVSPRLERERRIAAGETQAYSSDPTRRVAQQMQRLKKLEGDPWGPLPKSSTTIENIKEVEKDIRKIGEGPIKQARGQLPGRSLAGEAAGIASARGATDDAWDLARQLWGGQVATEDELSKMDKPAADEIRKQKSAEEAKRTTARHRSIP